MSISPYSRVAFRYNTILFLIGKMFSALLTFVTLLWVVRLLTASEYGAYVVFVAGMEITLAMTALGLPWVSARYLPEFRLYASGKMLMHFVWQVTAWIGLFLIVGALSLWVAVPRLLPSELAQYTDVIELYLLLLLIEGLGRYIRESILGPLMQQGRAQISQALRNLAFLLLIGIIVSQGVVHLYHVVFAELIASALGTILHINYPNSMQSYSEGARGLSVPLRVISIFTDTTISPSSWLRQCPDRYTIIVTGKQIGRAHV